MPDLLDIREKITDTNAEIALAYKALAQFPDDFGLQISIKSLENRQQTLEAQFLEAAELLQIDVCSYRIIPADDTVTIVSLATALERFQTWFTIIFEISHGKKIVPD